MSNQPTRLVRFGRHLGVLLTFVMVILMGLTANQAGWFGPPSDAATQHGNSIFMIRVAADGQSTFEGMEAVSEELREEIKDTVYPSPEAATEAVVGPFAGNVAEAHAVRICTHDRHGVVTRFTGAGRHLTWFRGHWNKRHHTRTDHQVYSPGPQTVDTFYYSVSRKYCHCN